ncbi:hypothetical protein LC55x_0377 [Lysobacter capsici]|nr:hypothetical protein LC55x_0377 [Lysobacter capsici]
MLLFSRVPSFAALDELRGFRHKPNLHGLLVGAAQAATAKIQLRREPRRCRNAAVAACAAPTGGGVATS